jgi:agmatine deiminase
VDGEGTVLATEQCLLSRNRNPALTKEQIEAHLCGYLGASKVIWLGDGVVDDETDGHVDNLACFAAPGVVLLTYPSDDDPSDPQHAVSAAAEARLLAATDARGRPLRVVRLPSPGPLYYTAEEAAGVVTQVRPAAYSKHGTLSRYFALQPGSQPRRAGDRLAASYANFYIANTRVVFPLLDPRFDDQAAAILKDAFPDREIIGIPAREILLGGGNIHCITQQVPRCSAKVEKNKV